MLQNLKEALLHEIINFNSLYHASKLKKIKNKKIFKFYLNLRRTKTLENRKIKVYELLNKKKFMDIMLKSKEDLDKINKSKKALPRNTFDN